MDIVSHGSLLLIDADPAVREMLRGALSREGRSIQAIADGREALDYLRGGACDVIVAGQDHNGFDVFRLLRRARAACPKSKVILAGEDSAAAAVRALRERAFSYLHKPLGEQPLADMVQQALVSDSWRNDLRLISSRPEWITIEVRCKIGAAERATQFVREMLAGVPQHSREDIAAAFRELLLNGIEHGANSDPKKRVRTSILRTSQSVIVHLHDPGKGFSLDLLPHAAICNPDDSPVRHAEFREEHGQRPGGFGILMARSMVDELLYNERGNAVLFVKYLK
jgi:CheY-like chemotaxis protein/anti-sigma regulatory factor (Ser/Thr protein kinase)